MRLILAGGNRELYFFFFDGIVPGPSNFVAVDLANNTNHMIAQTLRLPLSALSERTTSETEVFVAQSSHHFMLKSNFPPHGIYIAPKRYLVPNHEYSNRTCFSCFKCHNINSSQKLKFSNTRKSQFGDSDPNSLPPAEFAHLLVKNT